MSREALAMNIISKFNNKQRFIYAENNFLIPTMRRPLCNALVQPHFDYACSDQYPKLIEKLKHRIQTAENMRMCFFSQLDQLNIYLMKSLSP